MSSRKLTLDDLANLRRDDTLDYCIVSNWISDIEGSNIPDGVSVTSSVRAKHAWTRTGSSTSSIAVATAVRCCSKSYTQFIKYRNQLKMTTDHTCWLENFMPALITVPRTSHA